MRARVSIVAALVIVCLLWAYFAGCGDNNPTGPVTPEDYVVYLCDQNSDGRYLVYHPLTGQLDSFTLPFLPEKGMKVSADGKKLYVAFRDSTLVVDLENTDSVTHLPYKGGLALSPDNQLIAATTTEGLYVLRASDYSVVYHDTTNLGGCEFSLDSKSLYCIGGGGEYICKVLLTESFPVWRKWFENKYIYKVIPSIDESTWFLYSFLADCVHSFDVYDVTGDSIIYTHILAPGYGEMELTPDGRYVFYTNPDLPLISHCLPPPPAFFVYDVEKNEFFKEISTEGIFGDTGPPFQFIGSIEITPDGRWLVGCDVAGNAIVGLDVARMEIVRSVIVEAAWHVHLYGLTCQKGK